jgi:hypothetical protein
MPSIEEFDQCPKCDGTSGVYTKDFVKGRVQWQYGWSGKSGDNSETLDYLDHHIGKVYYCLDCDKKVCNVT